MEYTHIKLNREGAVASIVLDWAPTLNGMDHALVAQLHDALLVCRDDPEVKVIVLSGAGRAFCGGGDIRYFIEAVKEGRCLSP